MKHFLIILTACGTCLLLASCDNIKNFNKPHLELSGTSPYKLEITDFTWTYGVVGVNQLNGDFEQLDEKVYNSLKGKEGICTVYIQNQSKDKYGNVNGTVDNFGQIDLSELNKYQDWRYWHNNAGIRPLIYKYLQPKVIEPITQSNPSTLDSTKYAISSAPIKSVHDVYLFSLEDLHPSEDDKADIDSNTYVIEGTITRVNFDKGLIEIKAANGKMSIADFSPYEVAEDIRERLKLAIRPGNAIRSLCDFKSQTKSELVAAKVTDAVARAM